MVHAIRHEFCFYLSFTIPLDFYFVNHFFSPNR
ncbi:hypothetical protein GGP99_000864 [Salinibacter ruber]|uniref:Uncharacterized protein n=1 Tax=Salinibacter ruber TaxID=146919 RepID=A0AAW5P5B9_9BACT|nr:hypothetical protein [Salinibacter ruber]MCS4182176.1 hypothetical protein [Salinibacter ruber]